MYKSSGSKSTHLIRTFKWQGYREKQQAENIFSMAWFDLELEAFTTEVKEVYVYLEAVYEVYLEAVKEVYLYLKAV